MVDGAKRFVVENFPLYEAAKGSVTAITGAWRVRSSSNASSRENGSITGEDVGEEEYAGQLEHGDGGDGGGENRDGSLNTISRKEEEREKKERNLTQIKG